MARRRTQIRSRQGSVKPRRIKTQIRSRSAVPRRKRRLTVVQDPLTLGKEPDFLRLKRWTKTERADHTLYRGHYETAEFGEIPGFIECYRSAGGKTFLCFAERVPEAVKAHFHSDCFRWRPDKDAVFIHFGEHRQPGSIQEAVLSVERNIDGIRGHS